MLRVSCHQRASSGASRREWSRECGHHPTCSAASVEGACQHPKLTVSFHLNDYRAWDQTDREWSTYRQSRKQASNSLLVHRIRVSTQVERIRSESEANRACLIGITMAIPRT